MAATHTKDVLDAAPFKVTVLAPGYAGTTISSGQILLGDVYYGGLGRITGTVKEKGAPENTPLRRRVLLIQETARVVVRETWSDAVTGNYEFRSIALNARYTVVGYDYANNYRAVVADNLTPEPML